jgi:hypothetical protein
VPFPAEAKSSAMPRCASHRSTKLTSVVTGFMDGDRESTAIVTPNGSAISASFWTALDALFGEPTGRTSVPNGIRRAT